MMSYRTKVLSVFAYLDGTMGLDVGSQVEVTQPPMWRLENPPESIEHLQPFVGRYITVTSHEIYVDGIKIADRLKNYNGICLVDGWMNILNGETSND